MINKIIKYLSCLSYNKENFTISSERTISDNIKEILKNKTILSVEEMSEVMAFEFVEDYPNNESGWGTYYGPMFVIKNDEGQYVEVPSIKKINKEVLSYWNKRSNEAEQSILYARYADLHIVFSEKLYNDKVNLNNYCKVIDGNIDIVKNWKINPISKIKKLKRALILSIILNDRKRIISVSNAFQTLENEIAEDDKPGLWGFSFRNLVLSNNKIKLEEDTIKKLVDELEKRLIRVGNDKWLVECCVTLLAEYYSKIDDETNLIRVLKLLEKSIKKDKRTNSSGLLKMHAYERMHEIYSKYSNTSTKAKIEAQRILKEIGVLDIKWGDSMKKITTEITIEERDIELFEKSIFGVNNDQILKTSLFKIALNFLPQKINVEENLKESAKKSPLQYLVSTQLISEDGYLIAKLNSLDLDYKNHFKRFAHQELNIQDAFISIILEKLRSLYKIEELINYFKSSLLFKFEDDLYLKRALEAFWDKDFLIASHLFVPIIESTIRKLIEICGGIILKPNEIGGYNRLLLSELFLNNEIFETVYPQIGENVLFYFKLVLTEKIGMNLRNDFAHGFSKKKFHNYPASNRLFHIMLLLSLISENNDSN